MAGLVTGFLQAGDGLNPSKVAWLSLDDGDNDLTRFLTYFIAALQTVAPKIGTCITAPVE